MFGSTMTIFGVLRTDCHPSLRKWLDYDWSHYIDHFDAPLLVCITFSASGILSERCLQEDVCRRMGTMIPPSISAVSRRGYMASTFFSKLSHPRIKSVHTLPATWNWTLLVRLLLGPRSSLLRLCVRVCCSHLGCWSADGQDLLSAVFRVAEYTFG